MAYARALIKLSGEALMGSKPYGIDPDIVQSIAEDVFLLCLPIRIKIKLFYGFIVNKHGMLYNM